MTVDLPTSWLDASNVREVPDNQEVFTSDTSNSSVIFEILQAVTEVQIEAVGLKSAEDQTGLTALKDHINDVVDDVDAFHSLGIEMVDLPEGLASCSARVAVENKRKRGDVNGSSTKAMDQILIFTLIRLPERGTDILIYSAIKEDEEPEHNQQAQEVTAMHRAILSSFKIVDYSVFGEPED